MKDDPEIWAAPGQLVKTRYTFSNIPVFGSGEMVPPFKDIYPTRIKVPKGAVALVIKTLKDGTRVILVKEHCFLYNVINLRPF